MSFLRFSFLLLCASFVLNSCVKRAYDSPPDTTQYDPNLPVKMSLKDLSNSGQSLGSGKSRVLGDTIIYGVVVADDKSGNYYKQIVIEDTSLGGVVLYLDKSYLYSDYPVGRKIYVKLNGLVLANYNGLPEIVYSCDAAGTTAPIPSGLIQNYLVKANYPNTTVHAHNLTIEQVKTNPNAYLNT